MVFHRVRNCAGSMVSKCVGCIVGNGQANAAFLSVVDAATRQEILSAIAKHYGICYLAAWDEVKSDEAEHLLDYLTGSIRSATSVLMQRHGFAVGC